MATTARYGTAQAVAQERAGGHAGGIEADRSVKLLQITAAIADAVSAEQVFEALVDQVAAVLGASSAGLWLIQEADRAAVLVRSVGYQEASRAQLQRLSLESGIESPVLDVLRHGVAAWIPSQQELLRRYPGLAGVATPKRAYRIACLPLVAAGRTLGALGLTIEEEREPSTDERSFLFLVARYASQALERLRLLEAERESRAQADAAAADAGQLYRFAHAVVVADKQEEVFEAALDAIETALRVERAAVLIFDADHVMRFRSFRGLSEQYLRAVEGHSPWSVDTTEPEPVLVPDVEADPSLAAFAPVFRSEGIAALAFFPIQNRGKLLGKLMVYHRARHDYTERELEVVSSIGNHLGSVVARFTAIEQLQETVRYNELFAGVLAHDLRNPLAAVVTAAQLLRMRLGEADEKVAKPVAKILSSGQRMGRMIEQLLDVTRARAGGGIELRPHRFDLSEVCDQMAGELELAHPGWSIECRYHGDPIGTWDRDRLAQVLSNLIANAGQHGRPERGILVSVDGRDLATVKLAVHNHGAIPTELLPTLFDPFRSAASRREQARGLGLGLYIVKEIVRTHGGAITVDSSPELGTTFTISLPR